MDRHPSDAALDIAPQPDSDLPEDSAEVRLGREQTFHWGPRLIDLDILFYDDLILKTESLTIPHPHLHERAFVLVPLAEIAPDFIHPVLKKTIKELLMSVDVDNIHPYK